MLVGVAVPELAAGATVVPLLAGGGAGWLEYTGTGALDCGGAGAGTGCEAGAGGALDT